MKKFNKIIYTILGIISFGIGAIGVIIPVLPTTPFLLLASYCFVKGSDKFEAWFKSTKIYKDHLEFFIEKKSMTKKQKIRILLFADCMLLVPLIMIDSTHIRIFLVLLILFKLYYFIFRIKTISENEFEKEK